MPKLVKKLPSYRRHKVSGHAVVTLNGRDHYLGPHGSPESVAANRMELEHYGLCEEIVHFKRRWFVVLDDAEVVLSKVITRHRPIREMTTGHAECPPDWPEPDE